MGIVDTFWANMYKNLLSRPFIGLAGDTIEEQKMIEAKTIVDRRLILVPLSVTDAPEMVHVLADESLYVFTGGQPPGLATLQGRYAQQVAGPESGEEVWLNWIVRLVDSDVAVGYVQATVIGDTADLAWLIGVAHQGEGYACQAAEAMDYWLVCQGMQHFAAHIHPEHRTSQRVAESIGLEDSGAVDEDGETIWARSL